MLEATGHKRWAKELLSGEKYSLFVSIFTCRRLQNNEVRKTY